MDLALAVEVFCHDGRCGRSTNGILNPTTHEVAHLVVAQDAPPLPDRFSRPDRPTQRPASRSAWTCDTVGFPILKLHASKGGPAAP